jgi:hypothetical protein
MLRLGAGQIIELAYISRAGMALARGFDAFGRTILRDVN